MKKNEQDNSYKVPESTKAEKRGVGFPPQINLPLTFMRD